jgi:hypothetical protein
MSDSEVEKTPENPTSWAAYWAREFQGADEGFKDFHKKSKKVVSKFLDDRNDEKGEGIVTTRLNLFYSNITTLRAMLYGRLPKVDVDRRFADANDDVSRVASVIQERMLNLDIQNAGEKYSNVMRTALDDRLLVGLGEVRLRYQFESEKVPAITDPTTGTVVAPESERIKDEWVDEIYTHWQDVKWSPCRTYPEMRWKAYREYLCRSELVKRFPELGGQVPLSSKGPMATVSDGAGLDKKVQDQAEVWEIWDKEHLKTFWYVSGFDKILDVKDDPLELEDFWPGPAPMLANCTSSKLMPRADYIIAQDLYQAIDELETRITILTDAVKVIGVYDKSAEGVQNMIKEGVDTDLIPVDNWAMFSEKGGISGVIDWMPIEAIVEAIMQLTQKQEQKIAQLYQLTGMSDIMRGQATDSRVSATEQSLKAKFASIRVQALQDEFARFASDMQTIKGEIIAKHFQPDTILRQSNIQATYDGQNQQLVQAAIQLIKNPEVAKFRLVVRPETLAMADYAQIKQDRTEFLNGMATFMQSSAPLLQMDAGALPFLLEMLKWGLAGFKGANEIEGVIDQMIAQKTTEMQQSQGQPKPPSPEEIKAQTEKKMMEMKMQMEQTKHQMDMMRDQQKMKNEMMMAQFKIQAQQAADGMKLEQLRKEFDLKMAQQNAEFELEMKVLDERLRAERIAADTERQIVESKHQQTMQHSEQTHRQAMRQGPAK